MDTTSSPEKVGEQAFYFQFGYSRGGRWLERLTQQPEDADDMPLIPEFTWPTDARVEVRVAVFKADGRLFAGAVEVRTAPESVDVPALGLTIPAPPVDPMPVDTDLWRMVPVGALTKEAVRDLLIETAPYEVTAKLAADPDAYERIADEMSAGSRGRRSPGRPSKLSPALMEFVAAAHRNAGPREGQPAVRVALQYAADRTEEGTALPGMEFRGSGVDGEVTVDQVKATITRLRAAGLIPPTNKRRDTTDDQ